MMTTIDNDITDIEGRLDQEIAQRERANKKTLSEKYILETQKVYHKT